MNLQQVRKNGIHILTAAMIAAFMVVAGPLMTAGVYAADSGIPDGETYNYGPDFPHVKMRDLFTTETVTVEPIRIVEVQKDEDGNILTDENGKAFTRDPEQEISFRIFDTTSQENAFGGLRETVSTYIDEEGKSWLPAMELKKDHDFIFFVEDSDYRYPRGEQYPSLNKVYAQVRSGDAVTATEGAGAYDYMADSRVYDRITEIEVERRDSVCDDPFNENRYDTSSNNSIKVTYKGAARAGIRFRLVSEAETIETVTENGGVFRADLIEGVTYMVYVLSDKYDIDPFPMIAKDKSEYKSDNGLYCYNHSTCIRVNEIRLYDKGDTVFDGFDRITKVNSLMERSVVTGMNFKNLMIIDRILDDRVDALNGKAYEVISICAFNPMRWELSKLTGQNFGITWKKCGGRLVRQVYSLKDGKLTKIGFSQTAGSTVSFNMDSLSLYPAVIEYDSSMTYADKIAADKAAKEKAAAEKAAAEKKAKEAAAEAKAKKVKTVTVNVATVSAKAIDKAVEKKGGSSKYVTKIVLGKKVKKISPKAFAKYNKVTALEVKTKKLTKKSVKGAFKGSKVKTVKVKVSSKAKTNRNYVKKYKKIFTKKNAGKKVKVK